MKNYLRLFIGSYTQPSGKWLLSALFGMLILPFLLKSVIMLIRQTILPGWITLAAQLAGWLAAWIFLYVSLRSLQQQQQKTPVRSNRGFWQTSLTRRLVASVHSPCA